MQVPIILQALPLSLGTFWRYLLVLPFMIVVLAMLFIATIIPLLGLPAMGAAITYSMVVGLSCALLARGHVDLVGFGGKLKISVLYGLATIALAVFAVGIAYLVTTVFKSDLLASLRAEEITALFNAGSVLAYILALLWLAAIAVPITAAEIERKTTESVGLVSGFGVGMFGLVLINLVGIFIGNYFWTNADIPAIIHQLQEMVAAQFTGLPYEWTLHIDPIRLLAGFLFMIWATSWYSTAAVLYWERKVAQRAVARAKAQQLLRVSHEDLRALRLARDQRAAL